MKSLEEVLVAINFCMLNVDLLTQSEVGFLEELEHSISDGRRLHPKQLETLAGIERRIGAQVDAKN